MKNTFSALYAASVVPAVVSVAMFFASSAFAAGGSTGVLQAPANDGIKGNASAGKAKSASCAACHGKDGNSAAPSFPKLAGQGEKYLIKQMEDIKSGARVVPTMAGQLNGKSEQDLADIAAYYASKKSSNGQTKADLAELGENIYRGGISDRNVPACAACHASSGAGMPAAGFPALAGQHAEYTAAQLREFRAAEDSSIDDKKTGRRNDGDSKIMRTIAYRMTDRQIEAVSSYIQGLYVAEE